MATYNTEDSKKLLSTSFKGSGARKRHLLACRIKSMFKGGAYEAVANNLETLCLFIGYPRSGHSLVGSLLDAHPEMIVAHEADLLDYFQEGFSRRQLLYVLLENSRVFTRHGRAWTDYSYEVPNQYNGRFETLKVIGDKKGLKTAFALDEDPGLAERLRECMGVPVKLVHVTRNPFDNISTIKMREDVTLDKSIEIYFGIADAVKGQKERWPEEHWFDLRHEDLFVDAHTHLKALVEYFGREASEQYLSDCASIIFDQPNQSRHKLADEWTPERIAEIEARLQHYPFLASYRFAV